MRQTILPPAASWTRGLHVVGSVVLFGSPSGAALRLVESRLSLSVSPVVVTADVGRVAELRAVDPGVRVVADVSALDVELGSWLATLWSVAEAGTPVLVVTGLIFGGASVRLSGVVLDRVSSERVWDVDEVAEWATSSSEPLGGSWVCCPACGQDLESDGLMLPPHATSAGPRGSIPCPMSGCPARG